MVIKSFDKESIKLSTNYKPKYPGPEYYNLVNYSTKSKHESPCMSSFWRKIPMRINWVKIFNTINQEEDF